MPTPSEQTRNAERGVRSAALRSVFENFDVRESAAKSPERGSAIRSNMESAEAMRLTEPRSAEVAPLQTKIDVAVARSFLHRFVAKLLEYPTVEGWTWLTRPETAQAVCNATAATGGDQAADALLAELKRASLDAFVDAHLSAFGHAARGPVPMNEIEYGDLKADPLFQPHRLADLAAFYRAFGLEVTPDANERQDHICLQLEFMSVLAAKEAYALEHQLETEALAICRAAEKDFLREHLGRWAPAFTRRVERSVTESALRLVAEFMQSFLATECERFGVKPGSEDLVLRPVDAETDLLCASCGLNKLPPGALTAT